MQPWTYVFDDEGAEPFAGTRAPVRRRAGVAGRRGRASDREGSDPLDQAEVAELAWASFAGRDGHTAEGQVRIVDLADGRRVLRIEGLSIDNGPGLEVLLSPAPADALTGGVPRGVGEPGPARLQPAATRPTRSRPRSTPTPIARVHDLVGAHGRRTSRSPATGDEDDNPTAAVVRWSYDQRELAP